MPIAVYITDLRHCLLNFQKFFKASPAKIHLRRQEDPTQTPKCPTETGLYPFRLNRTLKDCIESSFKSNKKSELILNSLLTPIWKWMKERVIYNTYYREFEDFKLAVFGFFTTISTLAADSALGQDFRGRVRDKFRPIGT